MQSKNTFSDFFIKLVAVLGLASFLALFSYLNTVFGWTNPSANPPSGSGILTAYQGKLGINAATPSSSLTVNGVISAVGNLIKDVATPISDTDAANKAYVDAQVGATGSGAGSIVLYGVSNAVAPQGYFRPGGATPSTCYRSITTGNLNCAAAPANPVTIPAGTGAPACPTNWTEAYAGYGPHGNIILWNGTASGEQVEWEDPITAVAATYSVCSNKAFEVIPFTATTNGQMQNQSSLLGACVGIGTNAIQCNTCRVCVK